MSITQKTAAALLAIFLALFAGAWVILERAVRPGFVEQEAAAHARDVAGLESSLRNANRDMRARALDYARWDDTYAYVAGGKPSFIAENFPDEWFDNYGADLIVIGDETGRILWARGRPVFGTAATTPDFAAAVMAEARTGSARAAPGGGVFWTAEGPLVYGAARSTLSDGSGTPRGMVIIGRRLRPDALQRQVQIDLRFIPASAIPAALALNFKHCRTRPRTHGSPATHAIR